MLEIGHSHRRAVLIMWLWAGLIGFGTVMGSLYAGGLTYLALAAWFVITAALTSVVPRVRGPHPVEVARGPGWRRARTLC